MPLAPKARVVQCLKLRSKMNLFELCVVIAMINTAAVTASESDFRQEISALEEQIKSLRKLHVTDITHLKDKIQQVKHNCRHIKDEEEIKNGELSQQPMKPSAETDNYSDPNYSVLLRVNSMQKQLVQVQKKNSELKSLARSQATRIDELDTEIYKLKNKEREWKTEIKQIHFHVENIYKEINGTSQHLHEDISNNDIFDEEDEDSRSHIRKLRHYDNAVLEKIINISKRQGHLDSYQKIMQTQLMDVQRRLDHFNPPNWNLLSSKLEYLDLETKVLRFQLNNITQKLSDFDKIHVSMLELREDVEGIENKADSTFPELRKEISKLDIGFAQINAQSSYIKEDQENLRQSVKAIAVSISNAIDRAEMDRFLMKKINDSINVLKTMSEQHFYRLNDHIFKSENSHKEFDYENFSEVNLNPTHLMLEVKNLQTVEQDYQDPTSDLPKDCSDVFGPAGVYVIRPGQTPVTTWCANGTTLLQRRYNGSVEFNRKFAEYAKGFGDPASEYWIGLNALYYLTSDNCSSMRIDMTDIFGQKFYAQYKYFTVDSPETGFVLRTSGFEGNASDALKYQNNMEFSTIDRDRDLSNSHCARNYEGGWWFSHCQHVNINGKYSLGLTWFDSVRNKWIALASSKMRLYPRPGCQEIKNIKF